MLRWRNRWLPGVRGGRNTVRGGRTESSASDSTRKRVAMLASVTKNKRLMDGVPQQLSAVIGQLVRLTLFEQLGLLHLRAFRP